MPPQSTYPLKITEIVERDGLGRMLRRYREAFEKEEARSQKWRMKHDNMRAAKGITL